MSNRHFILLLFFVLILSACVKVSEKDISTECYGVWANQNKQFVHTPNFLLLLEKKEDSITVRLQKYDRENNQTRLSTRLVFVFDCNTKKTLSAKAKAPVEGNRIVIDYGETSAIELPEYVVSTEKKMNETVLLLDKKEFARFSEEYALRMKNAVGGWDVLPLVDDIKPTDIFVFETADKANVADCLKKWLIGSKCYVNENFYEININSPNYSFFISYGNYLGREVVYTRAAKISYNEHGISLNQYIRLMKNPVETTVLFNPPDRSIDQTDFTMHKISKQEIILTNKNGKKFRIFHPFHEKAGKAIEYFSEYSGRDRESHPEAGK